MMHMKKITAKGDRFMGDLALARLRLKKGFTLVIVKKGKVIFDTGSHGVAGFLQAIEKLDKELTKSSVADKIVGRAVSLLCAHSKVAAVFAITISEGGIEILEDNRILYQFEKCVPNILNHEGTDICPFEKLSVSLTNPEKTYAKLKSAIESMMLDLETFEALKRIAPDGDVKKADKRNNTKTNNSLT